MKIHNGHQFFFLALQATSLVTIFVFWEIFFSNIFIVLGIYALTTCVGGTVFYHRYLSHRTFKVRPWSFYLFLIVSFLGIYGSPISWAAVHREHHRHTDTKKDPHSPLFRPLFEVQFLSFLATPKLFYVKDLLRIKPLVFVHKNYFRLHAILAITLLLISWKLFLYAYLWPSFLTWHLASLANSFGHIYGYQNFKLKNNSKNNPIIALLTFGEGWHNNHHAFPGKYSFRHKWWEFDIGGLVVKIFQSKAPTAR